MDNRANRTILRRGIGLLAMLAVLTTPEVLSDKGNEAAHAFGVAYKLPAVLVEQFKGRLDLNNYNY
jgi:hypothetical protein